MSEPALLTSPRAERLRALCAQLECLPEGSTDNDVNTLVDEVYAISGAILANPAPGLAGLPLAQMSTDEMHQLRRYLS